MCGNELCSLAGHNITLLSLAEVWVRACPALRQVRHSKDLKGREYQLQTSSEHSLFPIPCLQESVAFTLKLLVFPQQPMSSGLRLRGPLGGQSSAYFTEFSELLFTFRIDT